MLSPYLQSVSDAIGYASKYSSNTVPVPELPAYVLPFALLAVLAASVWLLRKRSYNIPVLMK